MKEVLLMYSGGLDSFLSVCRLIEAGFRVLLVHFDNGSMIGTEAVLKGTEILKKKFGSRVEYIGIVSTAAINMRLKKIENRKFSDIVDLFGNATMSQYQCLVCRSAMYYYAAALALERNIHFVAEGARRSQKFAIEQTPVLECFNAFLKKNDIELLLPVIDLEDDFEKIMEINEWGLEAIPYESKCLLGYRLENEYPVDEEIITAIQHIFNELIRPEMDALINDKHRSGILKYLDYPKDKITWH